MKRINRYAGLSLLIIMSFFTGHAQQKKLQVALGYNINTPVGTSFRIAVANSSFRGANGEITYPLNKQLNIGLGVGFSDFYQKYPRQVYATKNGDISAVLTNSIQTTPVLAKANFTFVKEGMVRPYIGAGAGFNWVNYSQLLGEFPSSTSSIHAAVSADAGVKLLLSKAKSAGLNLRANFNYLPYNNNGIKNLNNWGVHAGVFFQIR
ncbi:MAG: outer membrane beta-barrel protein [Chitinophagaceae bacterium]